MDSSQIQLVSELLHEIEDLNPYQIGRITGWIESIAESDRTEKSEAVATNA